MTEHDIQARAARAMAQNVKIPLSKRITEWAERQNKVTVFFVLLQLTALIGFTLFEAHNSARGWVLITNGAAPAFLAYMMGAAATIAALSFFRQAAEAHRDGKKDTTIKAVAVAFIATALALLGVFSNVSSKTGVASIRANEINTERAILLAEKRGLEADLSGDKIGQTSALVDVLERRVQSQEGLAVGWGMTDKASPEECKADLRVTQRDICNALNGDANSLGLRNEYEMAKASLASLTAKQVELASVEDRLKTLPVEEGSAHWEAMSDVAQGSFTAEQGRIYGTFFASFGIMLLLMLGWDAFFEKREKEIGELGV